VGWILVCCWGFCVRTGRVDFRRRVVEVSLPAWVLI